MRIDKKTIDYKAFKDMLDEMIENKNQIEIARATIKKNTKDIEVLEKALSKMSKRKKETKGLKYIEESCSKADENEYLKGQVDDLLKHSKEVLVVNLIDGVSRFSDNPKKYLFSIIKELTKKEKNKDKISYYNEFFKIIENSMPEKRVVTSNELEK